MTTYNEPRKTLKTNLQIFTWLFNTIYVQIYILEELIRKFYLTKGTTCVYMMEQWIASCHDSSFVFHNIKHILLSSTLWCILLLSKTLNQFVSSTLWCLLLLSKTLNQFVSSTLWCLLLLSKTLYQFVSSMLWCILLFSDTLYQFVFKTLWWFLLMLLISVYFRFCMKFGDHVLTLCIQNRG